MLKFSKEIDTKLFKFLFLYDRIRVNIEKINIKIGGNTLYKRVLLKLSGEALAGEEKNGIDQKTISAICDAIVKVHELGVDVAIVVGGGNFWRGKYGQGMVRTTADYMGMLATAMNGLALQDAIEKRGIPTRLQTAIEMRQIAEPFVQRRAMRHLEKVEY